MPPRCMQCSHRSTHALSRLARNCSAAPIPTSYPERRTASLRGETHTHVPIVTGAFPDALNQIIHHPPQISMLNPAQRVAGPHQKAAGAWALQILVPEVLLPFSTRRGFLICPHTEVVQHMIDRIRREQVVDILVHILSEITGRIQLQATSWRFHRVPNRLPFGRIACRPIHRIALPPFVKIHLITPSLASNLYGMVAASAYRKQEHPRHMGIRRTGRRCRTLTQRPEVKRLAGMRVTDSQATKTVRSGADQAYLRGSHGESSSCLRSPARTDYVVRPQPDYQSTRASRG